MCGCERHRDPAAPCDCQCNHKDDVYPGEKVYEAGTVSNRDNIVGVDLSGNFVASTIKQPRLKRYIYKHAHECNQKNELYTYRPATQGNVMFPITPVCVETGTELMRVRVEDDA